MNEFNIVRLHVSDKQKNEGNDRSEAYKTLGWVIDITQTQTHSQLPHHIGKEGENNTEKDQSKQMFIDTF